MADDGVIVAPARLSIDGDVEDVTPDSRNQGTDLGGADGGRISVR